MAIQKFAPLSNYILGFDPGVNGACAVVEEKGEVVHLFDLPVMQVGKRKQLDLDKLYSRLEICLAPAPCDDVGDVHAYLERVQTHAKAGAASSFAFGRSYGQLEGLLCGTNTPCIHVTPKQWQRTMLEGYNKEGKDTARYVAMELFPQLKDQFQTKNSHNRADALLIAEYGRRQH